MVDRLSRFVAAVPMKHETAESCAEAFIVGWIATFGPPVKLLSDRGPNFVKAVMRWTCVDGRGPNIHVCVQSVNDRDGRALQPDRPEGDQGQVLGVQTEEWVRHVPLMVAAYNSSRHAATRVSPFYAMFGVEPLDFARDTAAAAMAEKEANGLILDDHMTRVCEIVLKSSRRPQSAGTTAER
mmetsp:Transcript_16820/g.43284  ORF Transcript_16820/g.43284 Transcript_16820/m.43284 type:complete len:182 (-) Transcript_16820:1038-1583(-)